MTDILKLKKSNCKNCYKCIRNCPVKSIRFSGNQAHIIADECILCGRCFVVCPQNAKEIRNDVEKARVLIQSGKQVFVSVAPSWSANYSGVSFACLTNGLLKLGFAGAEETAVGATMVKKQYESLLSDGSHDLIISSCCHTVNLLIEKYYPAALPFLANVVTPMEAHCADLKRRNPDSYTVFIGPCISKKAEARDVDANVDCALTFEELTEWFEAEKIELEPSAPVPDGSGRARSFPTSGGIISCMDKPSGYTYMSVDGMENCLAALHDIIAGNIKKCFVEMSACSGSCIGGPVMEKTHHSPITDYIAVNSLVGEQDFSADFSPERLTCSHLPSANGSSEPSEEEIRSVLREMGKTKPEDELNCGSCGYDSCREKAKAVLRGKADLTMCLPYLKERAQSLSDSIIRNTPNGIILLNEEMEVQEINAAALRIFNLRDASDVLGEPVIRITDPADYIKALNLKRSLPKKRRYLAEYSRYIDETVVYDAAYRTITCIMQDVTEDEAQREKKDSISRHTIEVTDKIIEKQMRAVQEIASLLGETTAETKIALTKLKESLSDD